MVPAVSALLSLLALKLLDKELRQLAVAGLGREEPTLRLSNNFAASGRDLITRSAGRNSVADALGISVNFFHLDCRASEVRRNVDLDVALTVIAHGCYRWLASRLRGFDKAKPKQLYRRFVATGGVVEVEAERRVVPFDKRAHNPLLREAARIGIPKISRRASLSSRLTAPREAV